MKLRLNFLLAFLMCSVTICAQQTIEYPYNPDVDNDEYIATSDLTGFLAQFGQEFQPAPVLIDSVDLLSVIQMMQAQITALQSQVAALESSSVPGLGAYMSVDDSAHTVLVNGANLQVVNGAPNLTNGKGNLILGYNAQGVDTTYARTGSHCLVMGRANDYNGEYSIVQGRESSANGDYSAALASLNNEAKSDFSAALGGTENEVGSEKSVIVGGVNNGTSEGASSVVVGGFSNLNNSTRGVCVGGFLNTVSGMFGVNVAGQENLVIGTNAANVAGRLNTVGGSRTLNLGGDGNQIGEGTCNDAVTIGGEQNTIGSADEDSRFSVVVGGRHNKISSGYTNAIFGGSSNDLEAPTTEVVGSTWNRCIFGGADNLNRGAGYTSIFGGGGNILEPRQVGSTGSADVIVGKVGATFVGPVNAQGGELVDSTYGQGGD